MELSFADRIREIDLQSPQKEIIAEAANAILSGRMVVFPTRNLYGLGALASDPNAIDRVYRCKQRSPSKPLSILIPDIVQLGNWVKEIPLMGEKLIQRFWPGKITIIFYANDKVPSNLTAGTGKIGIRLPEHSIALSLAKAVNSGITATSANVSGKPGCSRMIDLDSSIGNTADILLDAGDLQPGIGSTIVDITTSPCRILREGAVPKSAIENLSKTV
jgi:L-threonylcarbamoyladenylate synthase